MKFFVTLLLTCLSLNSWALNILQIGDSHTVGSFGESLYHELKNNLNTKKLRSIGLAGSSGKHWSAANKLDRTLRYGYIDRPKMKKILPTGTVDQLSNTINQEKPDILIIELSDNFAGYSLKKSYAALAREEIQKILTQISLSKKKPTECFWIGPSWTDKENNPYKKTNARAQEIAKIIETQIAGRCTFIDSLKIIKKSELTTTSDGLHFDKKSGELWGKRSYQDILKKSKLLNQTISSPSTVRTKFIN